MPSKKNPPAAQPVTNGGIPVHCRHDELTSAAALHTNPKNYRRHPVSQVERLAAVIKANGWRRAVVVSRRSGLIITGHGAASAGLLLDDTVPVEYQNFASDEEEQRHMIGDNKASEGGENDEKALTALIREMEGLKPSEVAMDEKEFALLMKSASDLANPPPPKASNQPSSVVYELVFDSKEQQAEWHAWLRKLKTELPQLPSIAARILFAITRPE